jgi:hypothetical protein
VLCDRAPVAPQRPTSRPKQLAQQKGFGDPDEDGADAVNMQELELSETEGITVRIADCKMPTKR